MGGPLDSRDWLADTIDARLAGYDPAAVRARLPRDLRDGDPEGPDLESRARMLVARSLRHRLLDRQARDDETTAGTVDGHLAMILDLAALLDVPFDASVRRAELASILAAATGDVNGAIKVAPRGGKAPPAGEVRRALSRAGQRLLRVHFPPGDPENGLPLYAGTVAIQRRLLARLALDYFGEGELSPDDAVEDLEQAREEELLLVEALAGLATADPLAGRPDRRVVSRQVERVGLDRERVQAARAAAASPREPEEIVADTPPRLRHFLFEQLLLASLGMPPSSTPRSEYLARFAAAAEIPPDRVTAMQVEAAAFHADHQAWFRAFGLPAEAEWSELADEWNEFGERMVDRVAAVVNENLDAIAVELRETGELGTLLAKAAAGQPLDATERRKVKEQLVDLAKAVPALAIFAAPGGLVLLPLLAKLLPFDLLPSAFQQRKRDAAAAPEAGAGRKRRRREP
ncbi:MAG TPA: LETM1 domain-containing protein [Anaeromyxobacteraceae bacterium]|nr:LETM1 domain-containing protein [Anaeromyxobacteraceae bacterium]